MRQTYVKTNPLPRRRNIQHPVAQRIDQLSSDSADENGSERTSTSPGPISTAHLPAKQISVCGCSGRSLFKRTGNKNDFKRTFY